MEGKQCKFKSGINVNERQQRKEIRLTLKLKIENMEFQQLGLGKLEEVYCNLDSSLLVFLKLGCNCKGSKVEIRLKMDLVLEQSKESIRFKYRSTVTSMCLLMFHKGTFYRGRLAQWQSVRFASNQVGVRKVTCSIRVSSIYFF